MNIVNERTSGFWARVCEALDWEFNQKKKLWATDGEVLTSKTLKVVRYTDHVTVGGVKARLYEEHQDSDPYPRFKVCLEDLESLKLRQKTWRTGLMKSIGDRTKGIHLNRLVYALEHPTDDIFYDKRLPSECRKEIAHLNQFSWDDSAANLKLMIRQNHLAYDETKWIRDIPDWSDEDFWFEQVMDRLTLEDIVVAEASEGEWAIECG